MVEVSDTIVTIIGIGIPMILGLFYFIITRKDRNKFDSGTAIRGEEEAEQIKQELARKVKKELQDEAEKVEAIRKTVASDVKAANQIEVDQKIREQKTDFNHQLEMYEERSNSRFVAADKVMEQLMAKMVETASIQANGLLRINDSIDYLKKLLYEMGGKVNRVEKDQENKVDK